MKSAVNVRLRIVRLKLERRFLLLKIRYLNWQKARLIRKAWPYDIERKE